MKRSLLTIGSILFFNCLLIQTSIYAQIRDSVNHKKNPIQLRGYLKDLQTYTFSKNHDDFIAGNLIHNRLNFRYTLSPKWSSALEIRNRIFWGEEIKLVPDFSSALENQNELLNMSVTWVNAPELVFHTTIDRLWLQYTNKNFEARLGRQRINWGISTIWNPNDIFNTYNFLDFDYEERPGRDAIKITHLFSNMSNLELVVSTSKETEENVYAAKYFFNRKNYDFQFIGGFFNKKITFGTGWSGSIGNTGFKGEIQYFSPYQDNKDQINFTIEADYLFHKSWYVNVGFLWNNSGYDQPLENLNDTSLRFSPKHLMPTKWNTALTISKPFTPLLSGSLTTIFAPGTNLLIILPNLTYNVFTNFDIDLISQSFYTEQQSSLTEINHRIFLRGKWSF